MFEETVMKHTGNFLAIILLCVVSLLHLVRLMLGVEVIIGGWPAPQWVSIGGVIVPALIAALLFRERKNS